MAPPYRSATDSGIDGAVLLAVSAFPAYRAIPRRWRAEFQRQIASDLEYLEEDLLERLVEETALLRGRVRAELDRTCCQLRLVGEMRELTPAMRIGSQYRSPIFDRGCVGWGPAAIFCANIFR